MYMCINITAARAVGRVFLVYFLCFYSGFEVREGVEKLPGGRGFVFTEYEPVASHGDPIRDIFDGFGSRKLAHLCLRETHLCLRDTSLSERV